MTRGNVTEAGLIAFLSLPLGRGEHDATFWIMVTCSAIWTAIMLIRALAPGVEV